MSDDEPTFVDVEGEVRDIGEVPAVELINTVAVHLMSAAAVKLRAGRRPDAAAEIDLDEARKLITLARRAGRRRRSRDLGDRHARPLRDGLRSLQLAFREASPIPDPIGKGPGEKWTGSGHLDGRASATLERGDRSRPRLVCIASASC